MGWIDAGWIEGKLKGPKGCVVVVVVVVVACVVVVVACVVVVVSRRAVEIDVWLTAHRPSTKTTTLLLKQAVEGGNNDLVGYRFFRGEAWVSLVCE